MYCIVCIVTHYNICYKIYNIIFCGDKISIVSLRHIYIIFKHSKLL